MSSFKKTVAQRKAIDFIVSNPQAHNFCLFGGSRSSKTFTNIYITLVRACKAPRSMHIICRETFTSAKAAIWQDTLPTVLRLAFPGLSYEVNNTDYVLTLPNKSTVRISGLDDQKKVERLLGLSASTLFFNECNQIPLPAIQKLKTRLAEKNELKKICLYDLNPSKTTSWPYQLFEQKVNPIDGEALVDPWNYVSFRMNPQDNIENIDEDYIKMLESLPEKEKLRFLKGEYDSDNTGAAVYAFGDEHISDEAQRLQGTVWAGSDFNYSYNSDILVSQHAHGIYVWDEIQIEGDTFKKCDELIKKGAGGALVVADSTGANRRTSGKSDFVILREAGFRLEPFRNPAVKDKIANLNRCFTLGLIKINPRCRKLIRDLRQLTWDKNGQLDQARDPSLSHLVDCLAYLSFKLYPLQGSVDQPSSSRR